MPSYFVKQPNGRLARFSTVVDDFTHMNMTAEEAVDVAQMHMGRLEGQEAVERALQDEPAYCDSDKPRREDGLTRWHACMDILRLGLNLPPDKAQAAYAEALERGTRDP